MQTPTPGSQQRASMVVGEKHWVSQLWTVKRPVLCPAGRQYQTPLSGLVVVVAVTVSVVEVVGAVVVVLVMIMEVLVVAVTVDVVVRRCVVVEVVLAQEGVAAAHRALSTALPL